MKKNNTPQVTYLYSLGKRVKDLTAAELKEYYSISNKYRYETKYKHCSRYKTKNKTRFDEKHDSLITDMRERYHTIYKHDEEHMQRQRDAVGVYYKERVANDHDHTYRLKYWFTFVKHRCGDPSHATWEEVVGCTIEEFKSHIESLWLDGMTWDNRTLGVGRTAWHLDHIIAVKDGGGNHYTNIQPLWCVDNLRKSKL